MKNHTSADAKLLKLMFQAAVSPSRKESKKVLKKYSKLMKLVK